MSQILTVLSTDDVASIPGINGLAEQRQGVHAAMWQAVAMSATRPGRAAAVCLGHT